MPKILIEFLKKREIGGVESWSLLEDRTITVSITDMAPLKVQQGLDKIELLRKILKPDEKLRLIEWHNDEHQPCKILYEFTSQN
jgi:hypothetical protein